jgi:integrase/recombinase XerD
VSEATGADIEQLGLERGHRTLTITRKGGKVVTAPLAPRTARAIDLAIAERTDGPVFLAPDGRRLDRHGAGRIVRKVARRAGIAKAVTPHTLRHASHHRRARRGGPAARRARGGLSYGSADHDPV